MDLPGSGYLFALGEISTTFVGFSALMMMFRQTWGGGLSAMDSWVTMVFIQLGFIVTAGSLTPPLMALCGAPAALAWRIPSGVAALVVAVFSLSYPARRRAVSGVPTPAFVWLDLTLLALCVAALGATAIGVPFATPGGAYSAGLTGVLFVSGLGYLHAFSNLHRETRRAAKRAGG